MVSRMFIQRSAPQPETVKTPNGGTVLMRKREANLLAVLLLQREQRYERRQSNVPIDTGMLLARAGSSKSPFLYLQRIVRRTSSKSLMMKRS